MAESNQYSKKKDEQGGVGDILLSLLFNAIRQFFVFLGRWSITVFWFALVGGAFVYRHFTDETKYAVLAVAIFVIYQVVAYKKPSWRKGAVFVADWAKRKQRLKKIAEKKSAVKLLYQARIIVDEEMELNSWMEYVEEDEQYIFHWRDTVVGKTDETVAQILSKFRTEVKHTKKEDGKLVRQVACRAHVQIVEDGTDIIFFLKDPLDEPQVIDTPPEIEPNKMRVPCAVDSLGRPTFIQFGGNSGLVIAGLPGSGKTAGTNSFGVPLALSEHVDISIIDGKGGQDWATFDGVASKYIRGDEDLEPIAEYLDTFVAGMYERMELLKSLLGTSNFWNAPAEKRLKAGLQFKLLIIDECQGVFDKAGRNKDEQALQGRIYRAVSTIVKRGRSAGYFVILMTQKPTNDSLPTGIRDNCGLRIAFRLNKSTAEEAALGSLDDFVRATDIPDERLGGAVMAKETGQIDAVRFYYIPEDIQEKLLQKKAIIQAKKPANDEAARLVAAAVVSQLEAHTDDIDDDGDWTFEEVE